jgi:23S rRNA (uracil1939-C5)-methyltransferase
VADAAVNLDHTDNVRLYQGDIDTILPALDLTADLAVFHPPGIGLSRTVLQALKANPPARLIYLNAELTMLARDGKQLAQLGYRLSEVQPIDMAPQTYQIETVSLWVKT